MNGYAAYSENDELRVNSSSGALFSVFSYYVLANSGVVYGVAMSEDNYNAVYKRATDENELEQLRGSKYLQAKVGKTYRMVKKDLEGDKCVLFTGTGCQINGLKLYLQREYKNLICIDVVCHGVPSPALWQKYVKFQEKRYGKLETVNFRCKDISWSGSGMKLNKAFISKGKDSYMQMFLRNYCLRPSCYSCIAKIIKLSDISIADFWGIEKVEPEMNDDKGISLVIVRTEKGQGLFDEIKDGLKIKEVYYEDGVQENPAEYESAIRPAQREYFFQDMNSMDFNKLVNKYVRVSLKSKIKPIIEKLFRKEGVWR